MRLKIGMGDEHHRYYKHIKLRQNLRGVQPMMHPMMQMGLLVDVCCYSTRMMKTLNELLHDNDTIDVYKLFGDFCNGGYIDDSFWA